MSPWLFKSLWKKSLPVYNLPCMNVAVHYVESCKIGRDLLELTKSNCCHLPQVCSGVWKVWNHLSEPPVLVWKWVSWPICCEGRIPACVAGEYHGECSSCRSTGTLSDMWKSRLDRGLSLFEMNKGHKIACYMRSITMCLHVAVRTIYSLVSTYHYINIKWFSTSGPGRCCCFGVSSVYHLSASSQGGVVLAHGSGQPSLLDAKSSVHSRSWWRKCHACLLKVLLYIGIYNPWSWIILIKFQWKG